MEVPLRYTTRPGCAHMPGANTNVDGIPTRKVLCGMMSAVDDSVKNLTAYYKSVSGLWEQTLIIFSTDNGGNTDTGGSNWPLRGNKATTFEGGIRGVGWVGGGWRGVAGQKRVSMAMIHVSDW